MKITICGYKFNVIFVERSNERIQGNDGLVLYNDMVILIRNDLNETMTACVIRHELTHAIMCVQGRWSHRKITQEDMCEFIGFQAPYICELTNKIMEGRK